MLETEDTRSEQEQLNELLEKSIPYGYENPTTYEKEKLKKLSNEKIGVLIGRFPIHN